MTEYIYSILKSLSDFDFAVLEYASDGGIKVTNAAINRYRSTTDRKRLENYEINEITRLLKHRYLHKFGELTYDQIPMLPAGEQELRINIEDSILVFNLNLQASKLAISIKEPIAKRTEVQATVYSFLHNTVIGPIASAEAKEILTYKLAELMICAP